VIQDAPITTRVKGDLGEVVCMVGSRQDVEVDVKFPPHQLVDLEFVEDGPFHEHVTHRVSRAVRDIQAPDRLYLSSFKPPEQSSNFIVGRLLEIIEIWQADVEENVFELDGIVARRGLERLGQGLNLFHLLLSVFFWLCGLFGLRLLQASSQLHYESPEVMGWVAKVRHVKEKFLF
jgi:hypothetical protein